jgi:HemY protein
MLWSLGKILIFLGVVAALSHAAGGLMAREETLRIAVAGWEFTLGPLTAALALLALSGLVWAAVRTIGLMLAVVRFLAGDETAVSRYFDRNRIRRGQGALADAVLALAAGEGRLAADRADAAARLLDQPMLTTLLRAQAARMNGDAARATEAYKSLLKSDKARFVAIRGLMQIKLDQGDTATALQLAQKAFALRPKHAETQDVLLRLQTGAGDWRGARATLKAEQGAGRLPRDVWQRRDAVLALQEARGILDEGASMEAREAAIAANRASPDLIPAAAMAARAMVQSGNPQKAARILEKTWSVRPHPDIARAYAEIVPDETPAQRLKRFRSLIKANPGHDDSILLEAELLIAAEDFPAARRAMGDLPTRHPSARALTVMAAIERGEGSDDAVVRGWLARALTAPRGPQWVCSACHQAHADWNPICPACGGFDTLDWSEAPAGARAQDVAGAEMLPLIVGAPTPASTAQPDQPVDGPAKPTPAAPGAPWHQARRNAQDDFAPEAEAPRQTP